MQNVFNCSHNICTEAYSDKSPCGVGVNFILDCIKNIFSIQGDSGSPLIFKESDGLFTQIGILSYGLGYSCTDYPSGFTRVTSFLGWISSKTQIKIRP
jgi:secreted trypsin-like serine protease